MEAKLVITGALALLLTAAAGADQALVPLGNLLEAPIPRSSER